MENSKRKIVVSKSLLASMQKTLDAYRSYKFEEKKSSGAKEKYVTINLYHTPANKIRLRALAVGLRTTTNELINAILWNELLNKSKAA